MVGLSTLCAEQTWKTSGLQRAGDWGRRETRDGGEVSAGDLEESVGMKGPRTSGTDRHHTPGAVQTLGSLSWFPHLQSGMFAQRDKTRCHD